MPSSRSRSAATRALFASTATMRALSTVPTWYASGVRRRSALSERSSSRCSAREVNMRYGSWISLVTRSSISTPMYASSRRRIKASSARTCRAALMPAISPCAAASSYPVVPLICPARNRPGTRLVSSVALISPVATASYSIAYPTRIISTFRSAGIERSISHCTSSGSDVLQPCTYTSLVFQPSGSRKKPWLGLSAKRTILSSIDGQ